MSWVKLTALWSRLLEGIVKAKAAGVYKGRKPSTEPVEVARLKAEGLGGSAIAKRLGISRASVYHVLEDKKPEHSLAVQPVVEGRQRLLPQSSGPSLRADASIKLLKNRSKFPTY
jgi:hypothetical protein